MKATINNARNAGIEGAYFPFLATDTSNHAVVLVQKKADRHFDRPDRVWGSVLEPGEQTHYKIGDRVIILSERLSLFEGEVTLSND